MSINLTLAAKDFFALRHGVSALMYHRYIKATDLSRSIKKVFFALGTQVSGQAPVIRFLTVVLIVIALLPLSYVSAQTLTAEERAKLEAQLVEVEAAKAAAERELTTAKSKSSSLSNDIAVLQAKIKAAQLDIQAKNLQIKTLGDNITVKQKTIVKLESNIQSNKKLIGDLFRQVQRADDLSQISILLSDPGLSGYAEVVATLETVQEELLTVVSDLKTDQAANTKEKNVLVDRKISATDARKAIEKAQKAVQADQAEVKKLLALSKGNEKAYATVIAEQKKQINAINARLFTLAGGSNPIPFKTAYQYAIAANQKTGIDPAFLLAVLTQESNLGANTGTCYLTDPTTGAGQSAKSGRAFPNVMHPTRDVPPFLEILADLGLGVAQTKISCPQSVGWGGAMGPAQFIASTWKMFNKRVAASLGKTAANPWNPEDAFMASAIYLTDLGAAKGGYTAQSNAACRYYSGSPCAKSSLVASYGTSVMSLASKIQTTEIDKLNALR